jgi:hypothetical protein
LEEEMINIFTKIKTGFVFTYFDVDTNLWISSLRTSWYSQPIRSMHSSNLEMAGIAHLELAHCMDQYRIEYPHSSGAQ